MALNRTGTLSNIEEEEEEEDTYYAITDNYAVDVKRLSKLTFDFDSVEVPESYKADLADAISLLRHNPKKFVESFKRATTSSTSDNNRANNDNDLTFNTLEKQMSDILISLQDIPVSSPSRPKVVPYAELSFPRQSTIEELDSANYYITPLSPPLPDGHPMNRFRDNRRRPSVAPPCVPDRFNTPERKVANDSTQTESCCCFVFIYLLLIIGIINMLVCLDIVLVSLDVIDNTLFAISHGTNPH